MIRLIKLYKNYIIACLALAAMAYGFVIFKRKMSKTNPVTGKVTSKFGKRTAPLPGASTNHNGVDIGVPIGTEVKSPWDGTVKKVYSNALGGKQIIIDHSNGYTA